MNDPLADLLDHPPQDVHPAADPRFTAAVMGRIAGIPPAAAPARPIWWLAAAVLAVAAFALPELLSTDVIGDVAPGGASASAADAGADPANAGDPDSAFALLAPFADPTVLIDGAAGALAIGGAALILRAASERRTDRTLVTP